MTITATAGGKEQGSNETLLAEIEQLGTKLAAMRERISRIIFGQQNIIDEALIVLFAGGHERCGGIGGARREGATAPGPAAPFTVASNFADKVRRTVHTGKYANVLRG